MIELINISKSYNNLKVLENICARFNLGELIGIAGKNGSGKSTLLKIIASIIKPDSGNILIEDKNLMLNPNMSKKYIGYIPQENSLFNNLTVKDNISFFSEINKTNFDFNSIPKDLLNKKLKNLSGGMRKRVNIIVSMLNNPKYILMDEPTANLDLYFKNELLNIIFEYKSKGNCVILTSHDTKELFMCDKLIVLKDGIVFFDDNPKKLESETSFSKKLYELISS